MKVLIIAAGKGSRLGSLTKKQPKPLIQLLGLSLIERVILTAKQAGVDEFLVVTGYQGDQIKERLGDGEKQGVRIEYIENKEWERGNGISVLKAKNFLSEKFVLLMSDHICDDRILKELVDYEPKNAVVLAVDRRVPLPGDTKVLEKEGMIVDIGKEIKESNGIDTGIFLCSPQIFSYLEAAVEEGKTELAHGIVKAAKNRDAETFDIAHIESYVSKMRKEIPPWWTDIDTAEDLRKAKGMIMENASKNPSDALACYVHKPIENKLVAFIATHFKITPNQISIIVNVLAYIVTALFFLGYLLPASILTFVVGIADGLDGKLARVKLKFSKLGVLEHSFDLLYEFSWFIALSLFLFQEMGRALPLILCTFIILFVTFYRNVYDQFGKTMGKSLDDAGNFERVFRRVAGRRNLYNIPILVSILLGKPLYALIFILFHSGITAIVYSARAMKHMSAMDHQTPSLKT